jgi:hypothetical protein
MEKSPTGGQDAARGESGTREPEFAAFPIFHGTDWLGRLSRAKLSMRRA